MYGCYFMHSIVVYFLVFTLAHTHVKLVVQFACTVVVRLLYSELFFSASFYYILQIHWNSHSSDWNEWKNRKNHCIFLYRFCCWPNCSYYCHVSVLRVWYYTFGWIYHFYRDDHRFSYTHTPNDNWIFIVLFRFSNSTLIARIMRHWSSLSPWHEDTKDVSYFSLSQRLARKNSTRTTEIQLANTSPLNFE